MAALEDWRGLRSKVDAEGGDHYDKPVLVKFLDRGTFEVMDRDIVEDEFYVLRPHKILRELDAAGKDLEQAIRDAQRDVPARSSQRSRGGRSGTSQGGNNRGGNQSGNRGGRGNRSSGSRSDARGGDKPAATKDGEAKTGAKRGSRRGRRRGRRTGKSGPDKGGGTGTAPKAN